MHLFTWQIFPGTSYEVRDYSGPWGYRVGKGGRAPALVELTFQRERLTVNQLINKKSFRVVISTVQKIKREMQWE